MAIDWQVILTGLVVAAAAGELLRRAVGSLGSKPKAGCGGCGSCPHPGQTPPIVELRAEPPTLDLGRRERVQWEGQAPADP